MAWSPWRLSERVSDMRAHVFFAVLLLAGQAIAQPAEPAQYRTKIEHFPVHCPLDASQHSVSECTQRIRLIVANAPQDLEAAEFECVTTWELDIDSDQPEYLEFTTRVPIRFKAGSGAKTFERTQNLDDIPEDVQGVRKAETSCTPS